MDSEIVLKDGCIHILISLEHQLGQVIEKAKDVCNIRYSNTEWDELNNAIGQLIDALTVLGVDFNNPRIIS